MKKILTHLTGIVFLITILAAAGCNSGENQTDATVEEIDPVEAAIEQIKALDDSKKVEIFLKDVLINDTMHLFMYDDKKPIECGVIDDHLVVVKRNYTVTWNKADDSNIDKILHIRPVGDTAFWGAVPEEEVNLGRSLHKLVIPNTAKLDTLIKYEIIFTVKKDSTEYGIDPYLKVPDQ